MATIALKVDVDTLRGTREGVPALLRALTRANAPATFLFSLGPDRTGRAIRRVFRPGFFGKVSRTSVLSHYGVRTLLYGTLLPGPDIGRRERETLRSVARAGFECGVHTWDHVAWQDKLEHASEAWTASQMRLAAERFAEIYGRAPKVHGAAGWQMNDAALRLESALDYAVASDTRGDRPFVPVGAQGGVLGPPQFPTTLPTMDELIGRDGVTGESVADALLRSTRDAEGVQVYTLHAELEGQKLAGAFDALLAGWRAQGHAYASLGELAARTDARALPHCRIVAGTVPGRSGTLAIQGKALDVRPAATA